MAQHNMNSVFYATTYHPIQAGSIDGTDTASHDNGVYRALVAASTGLYDPTGDAKTEGDPYCTLFVGRLAHHTTEKTLHEVMSKYGRVKRLRLVRHIGASRGYAFVEFESEYDMQNAYEVAQHDVIEGSSILVDYNRQQLMPGWIPRRLGGGLGGRKESGQLRFGGRDRPFRAPLRTIPIEQLTKLGIPLPPVGRYMSRFQLPPIPRRPGSSKEGAHHRQKSAHRRGPTQEDDRAELERRAESSSKLGRRSVGAERESSTHEHRSRHRAEEDADRVYEDEKQHRKRTHSDQEDGHVDRERSSRGGHGGTESSRHRDRGREYLNEHKKRRHSGLGGDQAEHEKSTTSGNNEDEESIQNQDQRHGLRKDLRKRSPFSEDLDEQDYAKSTRSGHEDNDSSRHHERSRSRSKHKHRDSGHHGSSTSKSRHKDRDGGHRHKSDRSSLSRESTVEHDRSTKHGSEQSRSRESKHRKTDD